MSNQNKFKTCPKCKKDELEEFEKGHYICNNCGKEIFPDEVEGCNCSSGCGCGAK